MVNHLGNWLRIPFGTSYRISLQGLSRLQGTGFRVPLRVLSGFLFTLGLVVPAHRILVPVLCYFEFLCIFVLVLHILVSLFYGTILGVFF